MDATLLLGRGLAPSAGCSGARLRRPLLRRPRLLGLLRRRRRPLLRRPLLLLRLLLLLLRLLLGLLLLCALLVPLYQVGGADHRGTRGAGRGPRRGGRPLPAGGAE